MAVCRTSLRAAALAFAASAAIYHGAHAHFRDVNDLFSESSVSDAPARNVDEVNFRAFHDRLARYGQWMNDRRWGAVWRPSVRDFSPYRQGHWEFTQEYGTVWVSDYIWGDITLHYGRWFFNHTFGWVWVPGYVWGPAWVIWRAGDGKVGWLPMPPWIDYNGAGAFPDGWRDRYGYADHGFSDAKFSSLWCFVDAGDLYAPSIDYYVIGPGYNGRFIDRTVDWTHYDVGHDHLVNLSIDPSRFQATFGLRLRTQGRHDFEGRLGPITDHEVGGRIEAREHGTIGHPKRAAGDAVAPPHLPPSTATMHPRAGNGAVTGLGLRPSELSPGRPGGQISASPGHHSPRVYTHTEIVLYSGRVPSDSGHSGSQLTLPLRGLGREDRNPVPAARTKVPASGAGVSHPNAAPGRS